MGRTYLVITLGVGLGAMNTGNNLLYLVLGLLLSLIVASGILSERCLRGLKVRRLGTDGAFAGEPFAFRWAISRAAGPAFALEITEAHPLLEGAGALAFLPRGEEVVVRGDLLAKRRGPYRLTGIRVTTQFPLGIFAKSRVFELEGALIVYPKKVRPPADLDRMARADDGAASSARSQGGTGDVLGLVPLRDGEDSRRIHWLRSAALGQLVRLEREREERRTFVLHAPELPPSERLERECEALAATAQKLLRRGDEVGLETHAVRLRPSAGAAQERRILRALAQVGFDAPEREAEREVER